MDSYTAALIVQDIILRILKRRRKRRYRECKFSSLI